MARVRSKNTEPEMLVRRELHRRGFRFRLHRGDLPGRPDIVLPKHHTAILVHGCFWHRHRGCPRTTTPKTRAAFWQSKFDANVARDQKTKEALEAAGWRVLVLWECQIKSGLVSDILAHQPWWPKSSDLVEQP
jgi:DNA mismatch endonuclease (patch repair protein)